MYRGFPCVTWFAINFCQPETSEPALNPIIVAGKSNIAFANIGGITPAMLQCCTEAVRLRLVRLVNCILQHALPPDKLLHAAIYPIPKPGAKVATDTRPISLLEIPMKVVTKIISWRLGPALEASGVLSDWQFGFRRGRSATDAFQTLLGVTEDAKQRGVPLHVISVDVEKAFDSVEPWSLQMAYRSAGLNDYERSCVQAAGYARRYWIGACAYPYG